MVIPFDIQKVIQASAVLLEEHGGRISRLRLLKLLYIADREALAETLRPITGDHAAAMDHGPVPGETNDLIKRTHSKSVVWDEFIAQEGPQVHRLVQNPGLGRLSKYEIEKLRGVSEKRRQVNDYDIALETQDFSEWKKNEPTKGSSRPIPLDDLLEALNLTDQKDELKKNLRDELELDRLLNAKLPANGSRTGIPV